MYLCMLNVPITVEGNNGPLNEDVVYLRGPIALIGRLKLFDVHNHACASLYFSV